MPMSVLILILDLTTLLELHGSCLVSVERLFVKFVEKMFTFRMPCKLVKQFGSSLIFFLNFRSCGSAYAEHPCYLTAEPELPYPYCCPRSFCPRDLDIATNEIDTGE